MSTDHVAVQRSDMTPTAGSGSTSCCTATVPQTSSAQLRSGNLFHEAGGGWLLEKEGSRCDDERASLAALKASLVSP